MRTTTYEILQGPQTVTIIPSGSHLQQEQRYTSYSSMDPARRVRTYTVGAEEDLDSKVTRYLYREPYSPQSTEVEKKYTFRSESPSRGRTEERSIKVVSRSQSPARAPSPHPKGILRLKGPDPEDGHASDRERKSTRTAVLSTAGVAGTSMALTTTTKTTSRSSSATSSPSSASSTTSSTSSVSSAGSRVYARSDFSSYARTSSRKGTFYFAYGTHLSPSQLRRNVYHRSSSSRPIASARIKNFTWYIGSDGIANIASCPPPETRSAETDADIVWGLLYNIDPDDESELDAIQGWDANRTGGMNHIAHEQVGRPWHQGSKNATNKMFLMVEAVEWFTEPTDFGLPTDIWDGDKIRAMVYMDEINTKPGRIRNEYITRMSEAVASGISYGIPRGWTENVMRMYGIEPRKHQRGNHLKDMQQATATTTTIYRDQVGLRRRRRSSIEIAEKQRLRGKGIIVEEEEREIVERIPTRPGDDEDVDERVTVVRKRLSSDLY